LANKTSLEASNESKHMMDKTASSSPTLMVSPDQIDVLYELSSNWPEGVDILLSEGEFLVDRTILVPSNVSVRGQGVDQTTVILKPGSNCHLFTNADHQNGNANLAFSDFAVIGNGDSQVRPPDHKPLTFCCATYFKRCRTVSLENMTFYDIRQTAMHFNSTVGVVIKAVECSRLGWSGVSTSEGSDMWVEVKVSDAGRDVMHSAIHFDGGVGVYCNADVSDTTGNGIMLDSAFSAFSHCVVRGSATTCKRGVSLSGSAVKPLENVFISGDFSDNREVGVMVSNAANVVLSQAKLCGNGTVGLLMQGRNGGCGVTVFETDISGNLEDISEVHASQDNWVFSPSGGMAAAVRPNMRSLSRRPKR